MKKYLLGAFLLLLSVGQSNLYAADEMLTEVGIERGNDRGGAEQIPVDAPLEILGSSTTREIIKLGRARFVRAERHQLVVRVTKDDADKIEAFKSQGALSINVLTNDKRTNSTSELIEDVIIEDGGENQPKTKEAFDSAAKSDLRNAATAEEGFAKKQGRFLSCKQKECEKLPGFLLSEGVEIEMSAVPGAYKGRASHTKGTGQVFHWDSAHPGM